jgi:hypothetical protein
MDLSDYGSNLKDKYCSDQKNWCHERGWLDESFLVDWNVPIAVIR